MGRKSRQRGKSWENEVARDLTDATGISFSRNLSETRDGNTGDVHGDGTPLSIQCKAGKRPRIYDALSEAIEGASPGEHPVAAVKRSHGRGKPADRFAAIPWEDWCEIVGLLKANGVW